MAKQSINFTQSKIDSLPLPEKGKRLYFHDKKVNGLLLCITETGRKTFQIRRRCEGAAHATRVKLGTYPDMKIEQARKRAIKELGEIAQGNNPNLQKKANRARGRTLKQVYDDYLKARKALKPGTIKDYNTIINSSFKDWQDTPLTEITRDKVASKHRKLGKTSQARANNAMRVLRALFNFADGEYEDEQGRTLYPDNPVSRLSHTKAWYDIQRRQRTIKAHELKNWYDAVNNLKSKQHNEHAETARDYLQLLLFTGLRREEAARIKWDHLDFKGKTLTIPDTKNREPLTLPLSDHLFELFHARYENKNGKYVFASSQSKSGHIVNAYKQIEKVRKESGIEFSAHDLRRTFITIAESLDIPAYALKRLINHKMKHDVTAGYIIMDVERLREPMQKITDFILKSVGIKKTASISSINKNGIK